MAKKNGTQLPRKQQLLPKHQQQVRMDDALKRRIRDYQMQIQESTGIEVDFSAAVRALIAKGLKAARTSPRGNTPASAPARGPDRSASEHPALSRRTTSNKERIGESDA